MRKVLCTAMLAFPVLLAAGCAVPVSEDKSLFDNSRKEIRPVLDTTTKQQTYLIVDVSKPKEGSE